MYGFSVPPAESAAGPPGPVFLMSDPVAYTGHTHVPSHGPLTIRRHDHASHVLVCKEHLEDHYMAQVSDGYAHVAFAPQRRKAKLELVPGVTVARAGQVCMLYFPSAALEYIDTDREWNIQELAWHVETVCRRLSPVTRHESEKRVPCMQYSLPARDALLFKGPSGVVVAENSGPGRLFVRNTLPECTFSHVDQDMAERMVAGVKQWPGVSLLVLKAPGADMGWVEANIERVRYPFLERKLIVPGTHPDLGEALRDAGGSVVVEMSPDFWYPPHSVAMRVAALERHWDEGVRMVGCPYLNCVAEDGKECFQSEDLYDRCENIMLFPGTRAYRRGFMDHPVSHSVSMDPELVGVCVAYKGPVKEGSRAPWAGF